MQRVQQRRQRENRQETGRLKSPVTAYRSIAGSFSPATGEDRVALEEALADVVLFGSVRQVELAARCALALTRGEAVRFQPLIEDLRSDLRTQLGLEPIPAGLELPASGPGRTQRAAGRGAGASARAGGGGRGGGGFGGAAGAGGIGAGLVAARTNDEPPS